MKHFFRILLASGLVLLGIFLPYMPGEYDCFVVGLSSMLQFATFASLLLVPVGLVRVIFNVTNNSSGYEAVKPSFEFKKLTLAIFLLMVAAAALGALAGNQRFLAVIIMVSGVYLIFKLARNTTDVNASKALRIMTHPVYLFFVPLTVFIIRFAFLEMAKERSTALVIKNSRELIRDIETYKTRNGKYPVSLLSTIEDYHPGITGVQRFHYELEGNAYNLFFEQLSDVVGTQEFVMYNKLGEHEMTVHNQDLLRVAPGNIYRGYHAVMKLPNPHWKIFYFD